MSGLMDDYNNRLNHLHSALHIILKDYDRFIDAAYQVFSIEAEIRNYELRIDRLNLIFSYVHCSLCKQKITEDDNTVRLGSKGLFMICPRCIRTINQVKSTSELGEQLGKKGWSIKKDCDGPLKPLQAEFLVRKSEKFWLVHEVVADLFYFVGRIKQTLVQSWMDEMCDRLNTLEYQKQRVEELRSIIPDSHTQILSLQFQIQDLQAKVDRVKSGKLPYRCSQCGGWMKDNGVPTFFGTYTICTNCKKVVSNVMTIPEAEKKHGLSSGTIRRDNSRGHLDKYKKHGLFRQSGEKLWLIHDVVILDKYKELKSEEGSTTQKSEIPSDLAQRSASIYNRIMESKKES